MPLEPHEREKLDRIAETVARIDERTARLVEDHERLEVRVDQMTLKATSLGGGLGAGFGAAIVAAWELFFRK
jgi:hypothetical protein